MQEVLVVSTVISWLFILLNLFLSLALTKRVRELNKGAELDVLEIGTKAPDFFLETLDGKTTSFADYKNRESIMVFVSPTCKPCRLHMPNLKELFPLIEAAGIHFLLISLGAKEETQAFMEEFEMQGRVLVTEYGSSFTSDYKVVGTPSYYHIDTKGQISAGGFFDDTWKALTQKWGLS